MRIAEKFDGLRAGRRKALVPYICAGDPSLETTAALVKLLEEAGADLIEIGIPFSDPLADGPIIQRASQRALDRHTTLRAVLDLVSRIRSDIRIPIILMGYANPFFVYGEAAFAKDAASVGVDGVIVSDLPPEEGAPFFESLREEGVEPILLVAPTSTKERVRLIAAESGTFLYYVSLTGVTGIREKLAAGLEGKITGIRKLTKKPVVVGFGISTPEQARAAAAIADGVVVGSAILREIEKDPSPDACLANVSRFVMSLRSVI